MVYPKCSFELRERVWLWLRVYGNVVTVSEEPCMLGHARLHKLLIIQATCEEKKHRHRQKEQERAKEKEAKIKFQKKCIIFTKAVRTDTQRSVSTPPIHLVLHLHASLTYWLKVHLSTLTDCVRDIMILSVQVGHVCCMTALCPCFTVINGETKANHPPPTSI